MEEGIKLLAIPLGAFWLAFSSLLNAAQFVNDVRDTVVLGRKGDSVLSTHHRRAMQGDYYRAMLGVILAAFAFAFIIGWSGYALHKFRVDALLPMMVAALFPFGIGVLFIGCIRSDRRVMREALGPEREDIKPS